MRKKLSYQSRRKYYGNYQRDYYQEALLKERRRRHLEHASPMWYYHPDLYEEKGSEVGQKEKVEAFYKHLHGDDYKRIMKLLEEREAEHLQRESNS